MSKQKKTVIMKNVFLIATLSIGSSFCSAQMPHNSEPSLTTNEIQFEPLIHVSDKLDRGDNLSAFPHNNPFTGAFSKKYYDYLEIPTSTCRKASSSNHNRTSERITSHLKNKEASNRINNQF
jgi:hypothetical protein